VPKPRNEIIAANVSNKQNRTQMKIEFKEEQKFTQWWLWLILIPIGILQIF